MNFAADWRLMMEAHMPTLDVRIREDTREMLWRLRTGDMLTDEERINIATAVTDLMSALRHDDKMREAA
jgi:hypothetical protein